MLTGNRDLIVSDIATAVEMKSLKYLFQVVAANGELKAAMSLKEASKIISESNVAIQLRVLQTLNAISTERNSTVVVPMPSKLLNI